MSFLATRVRRKDEETSAHPGEKLATLLGKRNSGTSVTRCAIRDLELATRCLSWVRCEPHAQFFGGGVVVTSPRYLTSYTLFSSYEG
jgi:hypothetical protein